MKTKKVDNKGCLEGTLGVWGWMGAGNQLTLGLWRNQTHMWGGGWFLSCIERTLGQSTEKLYTDNKLQAVLHYAWYYQDHHALRPVCDKIFGIARLAPTGHRRHDLHANYGLATLRHWGATRRQYHVNGSRQWRRGRCSVNRLKVRGCRGEGIQDTWEEGGLWGEGIWLGSFVVVCKFWNFFVSWNKNQFWGYLSCFIPIM